MKKFVCLLLALALLLAAPAAAADAEMSLREKICQMLMVDFRYWDENTADGQGPEAVTVMNEQIRDIVSGYGFGAVVYFSQNLTGTRQSYELTMELQRAAVSGGHLPMLICADQEGGSVYRLGSGTALPGNMALGAAGNREYARRAGEIIGSELAALGINTALAPVADVNSNANNPVIGLRSFGDDPDMAGELSAAVIEGMAQYNVIGCAKHFPGHGDTATDSHYGLPLVDKSAEELRENELKPFRMAIDSGVEMIMTGHILYPGLEGDKIFSNKTGAYESLPATMSDDILTGLLKGEMGFEGVVVTDAMNMAAIADKWDQVQAAVNAIAAGADMLCMPCSLQDLGDLAELEAIINGIESAVRNGAIPMERIDDAVGRILKVKENRGILDWDESDYSPEKALQTVGSAENRRSEREMAAAAVTLVENKNGTLPLSLTRDSRVLMLVPYNNEQAQMAMGWNRAKEAGLIPEGAQVRVQRFSSGELSAVQANVDWADTIIINSEISSAAKMNGGSWLSALPMAVVDYAGARGKTTVVQSVDKPYDVQSYPGADAVLAVYGCKGSTVDVTEALTGGATGDALASGPNIAAGIEVIFGVYSPGGKLPVDIPRLENGSYTGEIVYPRGYGLSYETAEPSKFTDVKSGDWFAAGVDYAVEKGLMKGVSDTRFDPEGQTSRAMVVTVLWRLEGQPAYPGSGFADVDEGAWYADAVNWAAEKGIVSGYGDGSFGPNDPITRQQLAVMLHRYAMHKGYDVSAAYDIGLFADYGAIAPWAREALRWACGEGLITGMGQGLLCPGNGASRSQTAVLLMRFLEK